MTVRPLVVLLPLLAGSVAAIGTLHAQDLTAHLVRTTDASRFSPPSPDSAGITCLPMSHRLLMSDSEVNEMAIFTGVNLFETTLAGELVATSTTLSFSNEPTGLALNPSNGHLFVSDDNAKHIFEVDPGSDGRYGSEDDVVTSFETTAFGSDDPEGVAYDSRRGVLHVADGVDARIYRVDPGPNGVFDGVPPAGDDGVGSFAVDTLGVSDPEGIAFNPETGTLYVVGKPGSILIEVTTSGVLVRTIDISAAGATKPAGLAYGPGSRDPSAVSLYIVARGVDNGSDPNENDGRIFEMSLPADSAAGDTPPRASLLEQVAGRPPMGWNSFDAWDSRIDEETYRKTVDFMAEHLKPHGWEYAVIDYIWWNPDPGGYNTKDNYVRRPGHANLRLNPDGSLKYPQAVTMDEYGRLLPALNRFPSSADGKGFGPLADYVHGKGLKFGIHIMRGIHRHAYYENTSILGTDRTARDIAKPGDHASWLNNMFGVDHRKEGAQAYYDSIFALYAGWGVDYVKADDMMGTCGAPFHGYSAGEIEMMRKAIDRSGRPMVLSLSCGEAPMGRATHLERHANMWRVSTDFWDEWEDLLRSFQLLDRWSPFIGDHTWPDADMIPFGHLSIDGRPHGPDRMSRLTRPEHHSLMTLFSIARSPLMIGADLLSTPYETIETFFKNDEVLYVNQRSTNNRQVIRVDSEHSDEIREHRAVWIAEDPEGGDLFVALFNLSDEKNSVTFDFDMEDVRGAYRVRDLWARKDVGEVERELTAELDAHGAGLYRLSRMPGSSDAWVPPNPAETRVPQ